MAVVTGQWWALPMAIGADVGMWSGGSMANGTMNPFKWDYSSGKTWGYMLGGAAVGGLSGGSSSIIASGGGIMANTMATIFGSSIYSVGMNFVTDGQSTVGISFGAGSYNYKTREFGYLGKNGNSARENVGYGLGGLANLADVNLLMNSTPAELYTDNEDFISHSAITDKKTGDALMSYGPNDNKVPSTKLGFAFKIRRSTSKFDLHDPTPLTVDLTVNKYAVNLARGVGKVLPYQGATVNCVNMSSLSLWLNGIPNIGIHPYLLHATSWAYSAGIRPDLFSYYLTQH